jgi:diacylglycerol kinase family enzyme
MTKLLAAEAPLKPPNAFQPKKALVLFNAKAGHIVDADGDKLIAALTELGVEQCTVVGPEKLDKKLLQRAKRFDVVIVLGGDGTAKNVAELAPRDGAPLILLPGGTLNILPHALYGDLSWPDALKAAFESGVPMRLPFGRANGHAFYIAAIFGAPTLLARAREAVRDGHYLTALRRLRHAAARMFSHKIHGRTGEKKRFSKVDALGVLLPSYSGELEGEGLEWVRLNTEGLADLARVGLRGLSDAWRDDASIRIDVTKSGEIKSTGIIPATLDGEPHTFLGHVKITYERRGPNVIAVKTPLD